MKQNFFFLLSLLFLFPACQSNVVYKESVKIENQEWSYQDTIDFEVPISDTSQFYQIILDINHSQEFPFENLYVLIYSKLPNGERFKERVSLPFMNQAGIWFGKCSGENCQLAINLQEKVKFESQGKYVFTIEQHTRNNPIKGIREVGFRVEQLEKD